MTRTIYLAGPMRGLPDLNWPAFDEAARQLRAMGHTVINPADLDREAGLDENQEVTNESLREAAARDLVAIAARCDTLVLLPGWLYSKGAIAEQMVAKWLDMEVMLWIDGGMVPNGPFTEWSRHGLGESDE